MLNKEILAALSAPYDESDVRTKAGVYGDDIRYVSAFVVQRRLNEVLEGRWSFVCHSYELLESGECIVSGSLTIDGVTKTQYGVTKLTKGDDGSYVSLGTDIKSASADSLKRCAAGFGALDALYPDQDKKASEKKQPEKKEEPKHKSNGSNGGNGSNGNGTITVAQTNAVLALARRNSLNNGALSKFIKAELDIPRLELSSKKQASDLIKKLVAMTQQQAA